MKTEKDQLDHLLKSLRLALAESDAAWKGGEKSFAWIIGSLEGAIKSAIIDIEFMKN